MSSIGEAGASDTALIPATRRRLTAACCKESREATHWPPMTFGCSIITDRLLIPCSVTVSVVALAASCRAAVSDSSTPVSAQACRSWKWAGSVRGSGSASGFMRCICGSRRRRISASRISGSRKSAIARTVRSARSVSRCSGVQRCPAGTDAWHLARSQECCA